MREVVLLDLISIPLRYNLEQMAPSTNSVLGNNFNSTKVQFGGLFTTIFIKTLFISIPLRYNLECESRSLDCLGNTYFNSTKVQFGETEQGYWELQYQISIPLRYNLEIREVKFCLNVSPFQFH